MDITKEKIDLSVITSIIWDWNGTLINDLELMVKTLNHLLDIRSLKSINKNHFLENFDFPVQDYYQNLGFDFQRESYPEFSYELMAYYNQNLKLASLQPDAINAIRFFKNEGKIQYILSAMGSEDLTDSLYKKGIKHYFKSIYGRQDQSGSGKLQLAKQLFDKEQLNPSETLIIGDTTHDYSIAGLLNAHCLLIADGHQHINRLQSTGVLVFDNLHSLIRYFS